VLKENPVVWTTPGTAAEGAATTVRYVIAVEVVAPPFMEAVRLTVSAV